MYSAIDREDLRDRRAHAFDYMKLRLAILDFVVQHGDHQYLGSEADKVQYFEKRFQIRRQDMPGRAYRGANKDPDTIRHFVDKFPLFLDSTHNDEPRITLTFIDPGTGNFNAFKTHLETYSLFLRRIPRFTFLFASPDARTFTTAEKIFRDVMDTSSTKLFDRNFRATSSCVRIGKPSDTDYLITQIPYT